MKELKELLELKKHRDELDQQIESLKKVVAEKISPYKKGEMVKAKGLHFNLDCRIDNVYVQVETYEGLLEFSLHAEATIFNKNGSVKKTVSWADWSDKILRDAADKALLNIENKNT